MGLFAQKQENLTVKNAENEIRQVMKANKAETFLGNKSIKAAATMIRDDEKVIYAIIANVALGEAQNAVKVARLRDMITGALVITDQRLLFAAESGFSAARTIYLSDIDAIDYSSIGAAISRTLRIKTKSSVLSVDGNKQTLTSFRNELEEAIHTLRRNNEKSTNKANGSADEIKKFKELLDMGIITQEEFNKKKKDLLGL